MNQKVSTSPKCPLCECSRNNTLEEFTLADLCQIYQHRLHVDISKEFPLDLREMKLLECVQCGLQYFQPLVAGSPEFYAQLCSDAYYYAETRWEFEKAKEVIPLESYVLDVGCGDGVFLSSLPNTQKLGLEFNPKAVERAQKKGLSVELGTLKERASNSFDAVTMFQVLEHQPEPMIFLREAARVLRPGGKLIISVPDNDAYIGRDLDHPLNAPPHHPLRWRAAPFHFIPQLLPLELDKIYAEPLNQDSLFVYRRTLIVDFVQKYLTGRLPLLTLNWRTRFVIKLANALTMASMKIKPGFSPTQASGFTMLVVFRRR